MTAQIIILAEKRRERATSSWMTSANWPWPWPDAEDILDPFGLLRLHGLWIVKKRATEPTIIELTFED